MHHQLVPPLQLLPSNKATDGNVLRLIKNVENMFFSNLFTISCLVQYLHLKMNSPDILATITSLKNSLSLKRNISWDKLVRQGLERHLSYLEEPLNWDSLVAPQLVYECSRWRMRPLNWDTANMSCLLHGLPRHRPLSEGSGHYPAAVNMSDPDNLLLCSSVKSKLHKTSRPNYPDLSCSSHIRKCDLSIWVVIYVIFAA